MNSIQNPAYLVGMEARFARAARHSRMVRLLRVAVPAAVVLAMAGIVLVSTVLNPFQMRFPKLPVDIGNLVVSGTKVTMESPHLAGFSTDQRPYEMWAKAAIQDLTDPDHVELKTLRAKVLMEDKSTVTMDARTGYYDSKQQMLDLRKDIFLQSSTGYEARMSQAYVDLNKGTVTSDEHVDVKLLNGTLSSDKLRILNSGEVVRFEGNVVMNLDKLGDDSASNQPGNEAAASRTCRAAAEEAVDFGQTSTYEMIFKMMFSSRNFGAARRFALALIVGSEASAQGAVSGVPNAMQGFSQNRDQPIQIEAASLEMRDKKKEATFAGNVKVVQGDTTMTSKTLVVFYDSNSSPATPPPASAESCEDRAPADTVGNPRARRQLVDKPAGGEGQRGRDPEGSGGDRRNRDFRYQGQFDHHDRRRGADPVQERAARRPVAGGHDDRACRGSNPTVARCRACSFSPGRVARAAAAGRARPYPRSSRAINRSKSITYI